MPDISIEPPSSKACRVCGEEIKAAARKCIHCDSFQDWRANLGISTTALSLVVALVSVLATAIPIVRQAITPRDSNFLFSFQGATKDAILAIVANRGARPGTVSSGDLLLNARLPWIRLHMEREIDKEEDAIVVDPGKTVLIRFFLEEGKVARPPADDYKLSILFRDFSGEPYSEKKNINCDELFVFTSAHFHT
jgi:hypothetical protein